MTNEPKTNYQLLVPPDVHKDGDLLKELSNEAAVQRLQALLSEWLRMENLVVLTAAGCSVACGGKTMGDLEKAVLEAVNKIYGLPQGARAIIKQRLKDNDNIRKPEWAKTGFEQWLSYLVNSLHLEQQKDSPIASLQWKNANCNTKDIKKLIDYISKAIYAECALTLPKEKESDTSKTIAPHLAFLSRLMARDSTLGRTHLFTLNYDTLFEQAIERLGIQYFDGFSGRANARFDPSVYGLDIHYPGEVAEGRVRRFDKFLHFYKLHGSIHWQVKDGEIRAHHKDLEGYKNYQKETDNTKKAKDLRNKNFAQDCKDFGILPTSNKFVQTLDMPYAHLFKTFQARLSAPQTFLMVLGYGFGDEHVNRIIETALINPALIMLVVEPDSKRAEERIKRYGGLGNRVFVLTSIKKDCKGEPPDTATFDDFAKEVLPDVQWLDDFLKLRKFENQLKQKNESCKEKDTEQ